MRRVLKNPLSWVAFAFTASLLLGLIVSVQAFLASATIASVGLLGCGWPWITMFGLRAQLQFSRSRCREREEIEGDLSIQNRLPWTAWGCALSLNHGPIPRIAIQMNFSHQSWMHAI